MNYDKLCSTLLDDVFGNSPVNALIEHPAIRPPVYARLSQYERERIRWGYWTPAYVACIAAWSSTCPDFQLDNDRIMTLLEDRYAARISRDDTRVMVGNYLPNRDDLRALKRSGAVTCSFFSRIEDQLVTRTALAQAVASNRILILSRAFFEGYQVSLSRADAKKHGHADRHGSRHHVPFPRQRPFQKSRRWSSTHCDGICRPNSRLRWVSSGRQVFGCRDNVDQIT
jgi:hypothetical protein